MHAKDEQILQVLAQLERKAKHKAHRYLVVLSGNEAWVKSTLAFQLDKLPECSSLVVTESLDNKPLLEISGNFTHAIKLKHYLGSEMQRIIWDGFSGLNPDGLGAASGLLHGGGLFFLLLPKLTLLANNPDPDYHRMCSHEDELKLCGTRFLQRLVSLINSDPDLMLIEQDSPLTDLPLPSSEPQPLISLPTTEQLKMIEAIESVAKGHRKRPLVIQADRGRGKSSALGLAAAKIISEHALKVLITAPSRLACDPAFRHAKTMQAGSLTLEFIAPDELISTSPSCHLLLVDEAAAISSPLLKKMLSIYPRIVFATTIQGYEGNGQGFAVRFKKELDRQTPQWKSLTLKQPIRWADNDPLERWIFSLLMLDAKLTKLDSAAANAKTHTLSGINIICSNTKTKWIDQDELLVNPLLFNDIVALLVLAHYQTSPSDIRLILDHPKIHIAIIEGPAIETKVDGQPIRSLLGVILVIEEGGDTDTDLAQAIFEGRRRPRGQLVPQMLVASTGCLDFLAHRTHRIMRIAIHPGFTNQGLGSKLITSVKEHAEKKGVDSLSSSFGITPELIRFWRQNNFRTLAVGTHKDGASGTQSALMFYAISNKSRHLLEIHEPAFKKSFLSALSKHHRDLSAENVYAILGSLSLKLIKFPANEIALLEAYADQYRSFDDSSLVLSKFVLNCFADDSIKLLDQPSTALLIKRILQGRSIKGCIQILNLKGKKRLECLLKTSIQKLMPATYESQPSNTK